MRRSSLRRAAVAVIVLAMAIARAAVCDAATTVVTLCGSDDQPGAGINLTAALGVDPSGAVLPGMPEHIRFNCGGRATIRMTHRHEIFQNFDIDGAGLITLDGEGVAGMFRLRDPTKRFRLAGLTLRRAGGSSTGSGLIRADTTVSSPGEPSTAIEVADCAIEHNMWGIDAPGGSVYVHGSRFVANDAFALIAAASIRVDDSAFVANTAHPFFNWGGTVTINRTLFSDGLQSMLGFCTLAVKNSQFLNNAGGALWLSSCDATIDKSTFEGNRGGTGGAIRLFQGNRVTLNGTTFARNVATANGGAIALDREPGDAPQVLTIRRGTFTGNRAASGGAIHLGTLPLLLEPPGAVLDAVTVLFNQNVATGAGGAIAGVRATVQIARGLFVDNQAGGAGGALSVRQRHFSMLSRSKDKVVATRLDTGPLPKTTIVNTVIARNASANPASAFEGNNAWFINSSITRNQGVAVQVASSGPAHFLNTLLMTNGGGNCVPTAGLYVDDGHNLQFPGNGCGASISVADAGLDDVFVPRPGSPAFAAGDTKVCVATPVNALDLFGQTRPEGSACTIGAVEGEIEQILRRRKERRSSDQRTHER